MGAVKKAVVGVGVSSLAVGAVLVGLGQTSNNAASDFPKFNDSAPGTSVKDLTKDKKEEKKSSSSPSERPGTIKLDGDTVKNIREQASNLIADYCKESKLPNGKGKADKGGTCVDTPVGEVAKNPVRVTVDNPPDVVSVGKSFEIKIKVEDRFGPLDLNAFTFDKTGGAGDTFLEHPGELDKDGRPLLHCHLGITTLAGGIDGLPGENYDAAFSGVQGLKGNVSAKVSGLDAGFYRGDVYCSAPGHAALATAKATQVQAFDTFRFQVN